MQYSQYVAPLLKDTFLHAISKLLPPLSSPLHRTTDPPDSADTPTNDLESILAKEAVYCAVGRCAHRLKDQIDFNAWLSTNLITEAQSQDPKYAPPLSLSHLSKLLSVTAL